MATSDKKSSSHRRKISSSSAFSSATTSGVMTAHDVRKKLQANEHEQKVVRELLELSDMVGVTMDEGILYTLLEMIRLNVSPDSITQLLKAALKARKKEAEQAELLSDEELT